MFPKPQRKKDRDLLNAYHTKRCVVCNRHGSDPAHIRSRGAHGDDTDDNLIPLCRVCHTMQHAKGNTYMAEKYMGFKNALISRGWYFDEHRIKWVKYEK